MKQRQSRCKYLYLKQQEDEEDEEEEEEEEGEENISSYDLSVVKIGEGPNGVVYKCINLVTNKYVGLKKIQLEKDDEVPSKTFQEISVMRELQHPNIVSLIYVDMQAGSNMLELVYEFFPMDLKKYMETLPHGKLLEAQLVKSYLHQITQGIDYCHGRGIIHRELKPQNLLIDVNKGVIKLADFRLACDFDIRAYTLGVVTQWYRAPEVLLGASSDLFAIDIWSIGCIFSEMATRRPLFQGDSDSKVDQLFKIFSIMSTPNEETWSEISNLPGYKSSFPTWRDNILKDSINELDPLGLDLLQKMLVYMPSQRINAKSILNHPYFDDLDKSLLPAPIVEEYIRTI